MDVQGPSRDTSAPNAGHRRPRMLVVAMGLMWLFGMTSSASGCSTMGYLRGSHELPDTIARLLEESDAQTSPSASAAQPGTEPAGSSSQASQAPSPFAVTSPLVRASLVREQARLDALSEHHRRAFPLALGQLMLGVLLVLTAMSVLGRKPGWQSLSVQVVLANAALIVATHVTLAPVRYAMADAVADVLVVAPPAESNPDDGDRGREARRAELLATDLQLLLVQLAVYGFAVIALRRPQATAYFERIEARAALDAESDRDDS